MKRKFQTVLHDTYAPRMEFRNLVFVLSVCLSVAKLTLTLAITF